MRATLNSVLVAGALLGAAAMADESALLETGKKQFLRCAACHSLSADAPALFGPHLEGIVDRRAGTVAGYAYTDPSIRDQTFVWDEAYFDEWLEHPQAKYPTMCLAFRGLPDPEVRKALIAYLKTTGS
jgi:cytochrome c